MKVSPQEKREAIERLREWIKPGDTVYTIVRHRSRSGWRHVVQPLILRDGDPLYLGYNLAQAAGLRYDRNREGVVYDGCGYSKTFQAVYDLAATLYRDGFGCIGQDCPSSEHGNGDRDYRPHGCMCGEPHPGQPSILPEKRPPSFAAATWNSHWHHDGGYALRQRSL